MQLHRGAGLRHLGGFWEEKQMWLQISLMCISCWNVTAGTPGASVSLELPSFHWVSGADRLKRRIASSSPPAPVSLQQE